MMRLFFYGVLLLLVALPVHGLVTEVAVSHLAEVPVEVSASLPGYQEQIDAIAPPARKGFLLPAEQPFPAFLPVLVVVILGLSIWIYAVVRIPKGAES